MPEAPEVRFDPDGSLEGWDWITPEDLDLFTVSDEEFERQQEEFLRGDRLDARTGLIKKKKRVQGEKGSFERTYWIKSSVTTKINTPRDRQQQEHKILNLALKEHPLVKTAKPEVAEKVADLSLEMKRWLSTHPMEQHIELIDVNPSSSFATIRNRKNGDIQSYAKIMGRSASFVTTNKGNVQFKVDGSFGAEGNIGDRLPHERIRDNKIASSIKGMWRSQLMNLEDGRLLSCSPVEGDGRGDRRAKIYKGMGFNDNYLTVVDKSKKRMVNPDRVGKTAEGIARTLIIEKDRYLEGKARDVYEKRMTTLGIDEDLRSRWTAAGLGEQMLEFRIREATEEGVNVPMRLNEEIDDTILIGRIRSGELGIDALSSTHAMRRRRERIANQNTDSLTPGKTMVQSKAQHIAEKHGFAKGVASDAYLLAFDSAAAICDRRYGWKKGAKGKCERVTPQDDSRQDMTAYYSQAIDEADEGNYRNGFGTDSYIPLGTEKFIKSKTLGEDDVRQLLESNKLSKKQQVDMLHDVASGDMLSDSARKQAINHWRQTAETGKPPLNAFGTTDFISSARAKSGEIDAKSEEYAMRYWGVPYTKKAAEGFDDWEFDIEDLGWSNFIRYYRDQQRATISADWGRYKAGKRGSDSMERELVYSVYKPEYAEPRRKDSAAICDRRYGWKKGAKGKCERTKVKPSLKQEGSPRATNNRTLLAVGLGALATGAVGGAIGGAFLAHGAAQKKYEQAEAELTEKVTRDVNAAWGKSEEELRSTITSMTKERDEAITQLEETRSRVAEYKEDLKKQESAYESIAKDVQDLAKERDSAIADLEKANKIIAEKESTLETLSKGVEGLSDVAERVKKTQAELEVERGKVETLQATVKQKDEAFNEISQKLEEANNVVKMSTEAFNQAKKQAESEKQKFNQLSQAIDKRTTDLDLLTKKVEALKEVQKKAKRDEGKLAIARNKIADLEVTQRNLNDQILSVQAEKDLKIKELQEKSEELASLRSATEVGSQERDRQIAELNSSLQEGSRTVAQLRQSEAEAKSRLKQAEQALNQERKTADDARSALVKKTDEAIALEKELGITREQSQQEIEAIHRKYQAEVAKLYEDQAQILSSSPETFNQAKMRRSSKSQLSGVLSYSIKDGINQEDLKPESRFWREKGFIKEGAVIGASDRIITLEEQRIQALVAQNVADRIKNAPLAMSGRGGEKGIVNLRKRTTDLAEATALARTIADPEIFVGQNREGVPYSRKSEWRKWDVWNPKEEDSPTPQLLENEGILADAKLRDVYVYSQAKSIRKQAQESYREVLSSNLPPEQQAEQMKSIHQAMQRAIARMESLALGPQEDLFRAIRRDIEGRKDSAPKDKGRNAAEEKIAKVMTEFKAGKLKSSSGKEVKKRKQAIAIALSEAKQLSAK